MPVSAAKLEELSHAVNAAQSIASALGSSAAVDKLLAAATGIASEHAARIEEHLAGCDVVVTDIEGTTTPIPFVTTVLFPYAEQRVAAYAEKHFDALVEGGIVEGMRAQAASDPADVPRISPASAPREQIVKDIAANLLYNSKANRKMNHMKQLQGLIWQDGYAAGDLKGSVFADVPRAFERWVKQGRKVYIYSSGSIRAQKLLFGQTTEGDLLPHLSGHYDTTTGHKREAESYTKIAASIGVPPAKALFLTDMVQEAVAAEAAGMKAILLHRPENLLYDQQDQKDSTRFLQLTSFDAIFPSKKRDREE